MDVFADSLEDKRSQSDMMFALRHYKPSKMYRKKEDNNNPLIFHYFVMVNPRTRELVEQVSVEKGITKSRVYLMIEKMVEEIGYSRSINTIRSLGLVLIKILKRLTEHVYVSENKINQLMDSVGHCPVVFVPSHRSYADFILMAYLCFNYDIEIPAVVAGIDFNRMAVMSNVLRNCGAIFMRRSFSNDKLYAVIFKTYIQAVIKEGNAPFQFFIEGTRSRCGKSLVPKLGILKMILESFNNGDVPDILLVPISICYDKIMEDGLFAYEVLGKPKPPESTKGLFRGIYMLDKQYGSIYINFGDPISVREYCETHSTEILTSLAHDTVRSQQCNSVITCSNILSLIVLNHLYNEGNDWLTLEDAIARVDFAKRILEQFGAVVGFKSDGQEEIKNVLRIHNKMLQIDKNNRITICNPQLDSKESGEISPYIPLIMLQHYANTCLHFIADAAFIIVIILSHRGITTEELVSSFGLLRTVLRDEFVFFPPREKQDFASAYEKLRLLDAFRSLDKKHEIREGRENFAGLFCDALRPFLESTIAVYNYIHQSLETVFEEKYLIQNIRKHIEIKLQSERNSWCLVYAMSSSFIGCCLMSLTNADVFIRKRTNSVSYELKNKEKLSSMLRFLRTLCSTHSNTFLSPLQYHSLRNRI